MRKKTITKKTTRVPKQRVNKPFADGTMSNSAFFGMIRSALRQKSRFFYSMKVCRERVRIPYTGPSKRDKWRYKCEMCNGIFKATETVIHHSVECGKLSSFEDLGGFAQRLFCNSSDLMCICNECHNKIHNNENN